MISILSITLFEYFIFGFIILGVVAGVISTINQERRKEHLIKNGLKAEGVVYDIKIKGRFSRNIMGYEIPIIRFVTHSGEWITEPTQGPYYTISSYEKGDKVEVWYDPNDPKQFEIKKIKS